MMVAESVASLVSRARAACAAVGSYTQEQANDLVAAVAWAGYKREHAERLARVAMEETRLGRYEDKIEKIRRKTFGTLRDLLDPGAVSVGVISEQHGTGLTLIAKPVGVVAALCPSTNPADTLVNKAMMIVKGRNAAVFAPSPKGAKTCALAVELIHAEMDKLGAPRDLVQILPQPVTREQTAELMRESDLVAATGSQSNVRAAYRSGTPAIGVGAGNVPVIVDATADLADAAGKIKRSKVFDYATSCSSENALLIDAAVYNEALEALRREGGYLLSAEQKLRLQEVMFAGDRLSPSIVAQSPASVAAAAGLSDPRAFSAEFFMVEEEGVGPDFPFSGEKLSVVLTVYRYRSFGEALRTMRAILDYSGAGHSCGIHTKDERRVEELARAMNVVRVIVNQAHCFANGGSFDNGLGFTLSMGCGSWAKNSISENLSYRHFLNTTHVVRPIPPREPSEDDLFGAYWARYGG
ncbi:MAG TPA: aldehyde dehydrogenase family protein [Candidatus Dormibacteraeota bacterium]|nr:aldehyde dehydrogenase family protein [Candidatus Dormibacteraeota bacterium]